jgi:hypothetical protein
MPDNYGYTRARTHSEYVIAMAAWFRERTSLLRYTHITSLVYQITFRRVVAALTARDACADWSVVAEYSPPIVHFCKWRCSSGVCRWQKRTELGVLYDKRCHWQSTCQDCLSGDAECYMNLKFPWPRCGDNWIRKLLLLRYSVRQFVGWDCSVGVATRYGLDGPGIESRWRRGCSAPVQTYSGAHSASCSMGTGSLFRGWSGRGMALTTHPI